MTRIDDLLRARVFSRTEATKRRVPTVVEMSLSRLWTVVTEEWLDRWVR